MVGGKGGLAVTIVFYQKITDVWRRHIDAIEQEFPDAELVVEPTEVERRLPEAEVIVGGKLTEEVIRRAERLELIIVPFTGISHLPLALITERGVRIANAHGNAPYVAERAVALILAFYGRVIEFHNDLRNGRWHGFWVNRGLDDTWDSVDGKRCVVLGAGEIGLHLARRLKPFGVEMVGFKRSKPPEIPPEYDEMVYSLDDALAGADIVVVALPQTAETRGILDERRLRAMPGALLVNVGRGEIIEEQALARCLSEGVLAGAAIDTWYNYPAEGVEGEPSRMAIHCRPNVVLSPHVGGFTEKAVRACTEEACENLRRYLRGDALLHEADPTRAY